MLNPVIAIDIGHSAVKLIASHNGQRQELLLPSAVIPASFESLDDLSCIEAQEIIKVEQAYYFFGETAIAKGANEAEPWLSEIFVLSPGYLVLLLGALKKLSELPNAISPENATIVVGLPASHYSKERELIKSILEEHAPHAAVILLIQEMGPFYTLQFNADGAENESQDLASERWAIVDSGYCKSKFALIYEGGWIERGAVSCGGTHVLAEQLAKDLSARHKVEITTFEANAALGMNSIKIFDERFDIQGDLEGPKAAFIAKFLSFADQLLAREARALKGVVVAGGGAELVKEALTQRWPRLVVKSSHGPFAVAEGLLRAGLAMALHAAENTQMSPSLSWSAGNRLFKQPAHS